MELHEILKQDLRYREAVNACMNCGMCTSVCPAAEFSDYDPRILMNIIQNEDDEQIEELLKSDYIWLCGQCMSCKPDAQETTFRDSLSMSLDVTLKNSDISPNLNADDNNTTFIKSWTATS